MCHRFLPIDRWNRYQSNQIYRFLSIYRLINRYRYLSIDYAGSIQKKFFGKICIKIEFISQRRETLLFLTPNMAAVTSLANQQFGVRPHARGTREDLVPRFFYRFCAFEVFECNEKQAQVAASMTVDDGGLISLRPLLNTPPGCFVLFRFFQAVFFAVLWGSRTCFYG